MGVKGGCSPQNNLLKSAELVTELYPCRNKNFYKFHGLLTDGIVKHGGRGGKTLLVRRRSLEIWSNREDFRELPPRVFFCYAEFASRKNTGPRRIPPVGPLT